MLIRSVMWRLASDERGATAIEYGLIIGVLSMMIITAANALLSSNGALWTFVNDNLAAVW